MFGPLVGRVMPRGCLVIHPGALGDVLLALPALAHLGTLVPGSHRVLAAAPRLAALLDGSPYVERTLEFDTLGLHGLFAAPDDAVLETLAAYDVVVSWFGAADVTYRRHLARLGRPVIVARPTPERGSRRHTSRHLLDTLAPLGPLPGTIPPVRLPVGEAERVWAVEWLGGRGLARGEALVLHPGAGAPAKVWPGHPALARRLAAAGLPLVVVAGPADRVPVAEVVAGAGVPESRVARQLDPRHLAALLDAGRAFVGNDSGVSHLAAAVGCPTLALFGPTDPGLWAPGGPPGEGDGVWVLAGAGPEATDPWAGLTEGRVETAARRLLGSTAPPPG